MPNSVLWVFLIVVWLFVLVPMVLRGRPAARARTAAAAQTRVVHRGGSRSPAARRRAAQARSARAGTAARRTETKRLNADGTPADEASGTETVTAAESDVAGLDKETDAAADEIETLDAEIVDAETDDADVSAESSDDDIVDVEAVEEVEVEEVEVEVEASATARFEPDASESDDVAAGADAAPKEPTKIMSIQVEGPTVEWATEVTDVFEPIEDDVVDIDLAQATRVETLADHVEDDLVTEHEADFDILDDDRDDDRDADDPQDAPSGREMRGTGGYGPGLARAREEATYRERRRVLCGLAVLTLAAVVAAFVWQPFGYVALGAMVVASTLYLVFLRRAVRAEQARHAQRMARRRRREAQDARAQKVQTEPGYVAPPARLRRPGGAVVLEIDDEDPVFEHLPTYDFSYAHDYDVEDESGYDDEYATIAHRHAG